MKKFKPSSAASSRVVACALALAACACGPQYRGGDGATGAEACARVDSFFAATFPRPLDMRGRATFDVESYRVRGRFVLRASADGDAVLEFGGATLLGGHREDVVVSLVDDTLRVLDRERGRYYEGDQVERLVASGTRTPGAWGPGLRRVLADGCAGVESVRSRDHGLEGQAVDGPFELKVASGRLSEAIWPNPAPEDTFGDRLEVRYRWRNGAPQEIEALLPTRGWRIKLEAE